MGTGNIETNNWMKALKVILYLLLLTPLWFSGIFLFPFITTKVLYLRILVEVALAIYLILALKYPDIRPRWNWLMKAVWIYLAVTVVSSLFGVNIAKSFMGTVERGEGVVTMLHYAFYFTMLVSVFRAERDWYRYLMAAVGVIGLVGAYGLLQLTDFQSVISSQGARISSTIGNAAFFAAFMLFGIFLSVFLLYHPRTAGSRDKKTYLWIVLLISLFAIYESQTRGALVALLGAVIVYLLVSAYKGKRGKVKIVSGLVLVSLVLAGFGIYFARDSRFVQSQNTLRRLVTISPTDITTQSRFDTWNASWLGWKDRFVFGYGYENYNIAFNKYFPARIFKDQGSQIWFDRAHNIIFDIGTTSGFVGLVAYLGIFFFAFWGLFKLYKKTRAKESDRGIRWQAPLLLALGLGAYFIQNFFVFDTHATYLIFFIMLAYIAFLFNANFADEKPAEAGLGRASKSKPLLALIVAVLALFGAYFINLEPALANLNTIKGILSASTGKYALVHKQFGKSLSYGTYMDEEIRQRLVDFAAEAVASGQLSDRQQAEIYQFTIDELKKSVEHSKQDVKNYLYLMTLYNRVGGPDSSFPDQTLALGKKAIALSPTRPQIYFELGQAYFNKNEPETALAQFEKALELNPQPKESHFNMAVAAILAGEEEIVEREFAYIENSPGYQLTVNDYLGLSRVYRQAGDLDNFVKMHELAAKLSDPTPETFARLAAAYAEVCDVDAAKAATEKAVDLNSSFAGDASIFISQLISRCAEN